MLPPYCKYAACTVSLYSNSLLNSLSDTNELVASLKISAICESPRSVDLLANPTSSLLPSLNGWT